MHLNIFKYVVVLFAVLGLWQGEAAELKRDIPKTAWEPIFFESINNLATKAGWKPLRETPLPSESLEIRIWVGFGLSPLKGYSFRRDDLHWTGHYVIDDLSATNSVVVHDITPNSGWGKFWSRLDTLGLLTLPDSSTLPNDSMTVDGTSYVVEINQADHYRTYEYGNPKTQKWPEAKKMISIAQTLQDEFATR